METGLLHIHSVLRWVIFFLLIVSIVKAYSGWMNKKVFGPSDRKVWLFTLIFSHLTFLVGLYLLFLGRFGVLNTTLPEGTSVMKDKFFRFWWVEHPFMMLIAILLVTLGYGMAKKPVPDSTKFKKAFWFFLIAFILVIAAIPWPFRDVVARPWFPGLH
ncbi:MAG: hypothetical protein EOO05_07885 [Chitinophagaceae bacterium]|nr:MAG: hypothetical protein EOO05_07885 [Chitinophagaceae bacterium]